MSSNSIILILPFPPSVNALWRGAGKRVYRSKKYMDWIKVAQPMAIEQANGGKVSGPYDLSIWLHPSDKRKRDIDNLIKAPSDLLEDIGVIENDSLCRRLLVEYVEFGPSCLIEVTGREGP